MRLSSAATRRWPLLVLAALAVLLRVGECFHLPVATRRMRSSSAHEVKSQHAEEEYIWQTVERAARAAGELMREGVGSPVIKSKFNSKDLLTEVDGAAQKVIEHLMRDAFGDSHKMLGEESVLPGMNASMQALESMLALNDAEYLWIVDPIDGTTNFAFGMRLSAVSIGVYRLMDQKLIIAVIYDPFADEMFSSCLGRGSFLNGDRISVGNQKKLDESIVASGAPPNPCNLAPCMRGLVALAPHVSTTRMLGSAAIMLAYVACGRLTVYWETDLNSWDTAAGALLILEAGGMVTDGDGLPYTITTRPIIASNGEPVHSQVIDILKSVRALATDEDPIMPTLYNSKFYEPKK